MPVDDVQLDRALAKNVVDVLNRVKTLADQLGRVERRVIEANRENHATTFRAVESLMAIHRAVDEKPMLPPLADPFRGWAVSPDVALLISRLILERRPRRVLELGSGTSTVLIGQLLKRFPESKVVSLEHDSLWYANTILELEKADLSGMDVRFAPLTKIELGDKTHRWYDTRAIVDLDEIDFVVVDGPPAASGPNARYPAGPLLAARCIPGCLWVIDDTVREEETEMVDDWIADHGLQLVSRHSWNNRGATVLKTPEDRGEPEDG